MPASFITPTLDSRGVFSIREPFATAPGALYTCKSLRKLSDYVSAGEDAYVLIYVDKGVSQDDYDADLLKDMVIVGLQSDQGHWHYFPASYLLAYPDPSGVAYRKMGVYISLPPIPVSKDISFILLQLSDQIRDMLGVDCNVRLTENSAIQVVTQDKHDVEQVKRAAMVAINTPAPARIRELETQADQMRQKIEMLEAYIVSKYKPESYYTFVSQKDLGALLVELSTKQRPGLSVFAPGFNQFPAAIAP